MAPYLDLRGSRPEAVAGPPALRVPEAPVRSDLPVTLGKQSAHKRPAIDDRSAYFLLRFCRVAPTDRRSLVFQAADQQHPDNPAVQKFRVAFKR